MSAKPANAEERSPTDAKRARPRSLRAEIVAGFLTLLAALGVVGGYALLRQGQANRRLRMQNEGYFPLSVRLTRAHSGQVSMVNQLDTLLSLSDRAVARAWLNSTRRLRRPLLTRARAYTSVARSAAQEAPDLTLLARLDAQLLALDGDWRTSDAELGSLLDALAAGDGARARSLHTVLIAREAQDETRLQNLVRDVEARLGAVAAEARAEQAQTLRVLSLGVAASLAAGLVVLLGARRALRPLGLLMTRVRGVAGGDLTPQRIAARPDEIGELAGEFERMVEAVRARDRALRDNADTLRKAEQHLEKVVDTLRSAVMVVSEEEQVRSANPAARALSGGAALEGKPFAETPFGAVESVREALAKALFARAPASAAGVHVGDRVLDVVAVPFEGGATDEGPGALLVADDVTEREQARARLLLNERLAAVGRMAAHVTHEVRNPLSSMALNAEMLADEARALGEPGAEAGRLIEAIQREIDRLTHITEEYLRVARLPRPRLEREELPSLVEDTLAFARPELERAGVRLSLRARACPPVWVDEAQLRQALLNLLRNAREVLESTRSPSERAIVVEVGPSNGGVELSVCDSGPGLPAEVRSRLFELFFTTKERGTGLGLPLSREILLAHGGTLEAGDALPENGGGARFVLWLPVVDGAPAGAGTLDERRPPSTDGPSGA